MLYYDRIGVCGGTNINKASASKECDFLVYFFLKKF